VNLGRSAEAFYKWRANPVSAREWSDAHLVDAAREIHADDPVFGYRFIADELAAEHGITASENRVQRLCSSHGIFSVLASARRGVRPGPAVHDDLVRRAFTAERPNALWLTDMTEHRTDEGKLYLCAIRDACSGRIVGYSIDERMKASLAVAALPKRHIAAWLPRHRGAFGPWEPVPFRQVRAGPARGRDAGLMGRTGSCADNAAMESFFTLLQNNVLDRPRWSSIEELRLAIVAWIERTYHRRRRQRGLGKLTPVEFETILEVAHAA
jgi:putative transposase